jgi:arsenate reductase-like glutaredoxin family protein
VPKSTESVIYHNPRCTTSRKIFIERPFVVTPKGTRLARPIDAVREIL